MANVRTTITLKESLLKQTDNLARKMDISRGHLIAIAVEEFIERRKNETILNALNAAYSEPPNSEELEQVEAKRRHHLALIKEE